MLSKWLVSAALLAVICTPAVGQTMTMSKGQMLKVAPDGQITIGPMPKDAKMVQAMHRRGRAMSGGLAIWMDDQGKTYMSNAPVFYRPPN